MRILLAYDGSGYSRNALMDLQYAGLPHNADVLVLSISEVWMPPTDKPMVQDDDIAEYFQKWREQSDRNLAEIDEIAREAAKSLRSLFPRWTIKPETATGSAANAILSRALEFEPDIIVLGARGLSSNGLGGLGSVSQRVLTEAKCSVRIARGKTDILASNLNILIGFDNSQGSVTAVKAVASRQWYGKPEIGLVLVTDPLFPLIPGRAFQVPPGWSEESIALAEQKWARSLAADALQILGDAGLTATLYVYSGNPRIVMPHEAENLRADSFFVAAYSAQRSLDLSAVGTTALAIAARASCSVEVIKK